MRRFVLAPVAVAALVAFSVPALAEVKVGDPAPDFTLKDQDGQDVKLSSFRGQKNVLIAFYPKDFSKGCTVEMKFLVQEHRNIQARDFILLGVSVDGVESHKNFAKTLGMQFKLLADTDLAVSKAYDVYAPAASGAQAMRSAFVVDKEGKVRWLDRALKIPVGPLDGTRLAEALQSVGGRVDPVAELASLPAAERDGKTALVRFAQAVLAEDIPALDAVVDPEACQRPGEPPQMQRDRRKVLMDRYRALFEKNDMKSLRFEDVIDVRGSRVFTKAEATPAALTGFGPDSRDVAGRLADGEMLVIGRTTAPKLGEVQVLAREVVLRIKPRDGTWKVVEVAP